MSSAPSWRAVPMPDTIAALPRDERGFPVLFTIQQPGGAYDFRAIVPQQLVRCGRERLCGICGRRLDYWLWFMAGPLSVSTRVFSEPPMHRACLDYALAVCPWLAYRAFGRLPKDDLPMKAAHPEGVGDKPDRLALYRTRGYQVLIDRGHPLWRAAAAVEVQWRGWDMP